MGLGFFGATAISSIGWAALHVQYSGFGIAVIVVMGFYFAWLREKTGSISVLVEMDGIRFCIKKRFKCILLVGASVRQSILSPHHAPIVSTSAKAVAN